MLILAGSNALSAFRAQRLLSALQAIDPAITGVTARYLHFVDGPDTISKEELDRLNALLTYGDPFTNMWLSRASERFLPGLPRRRILSTIVE